MVEGSTRIATGPPMIRSPATMTAMLASTKANVPGLGAVLGALQQALRGPNLDIRHGSSLIELCQSVGCAGFDVAGQLLASKG
jgi:hypothetical protein